MAVKHGKSAILSYDANDISASNRTHDITVDNALVDSTCIGDTANEYVEGIPDSALSAGFLMDSDSNENEQVIFGQISAGVAVLYSIPGGGAAGATNPKFTGNAFVKSMKIHVAHDGINTLDAEFQYSGGLTRATS